MNIAAVFRILEDLVAGRAKDKARLLMFLEHPGFGRREFEKIVEQHGLGDAWARFMQEFQVGV